MTDDAKLTAIAKELHEQVYLPIAKRLGWPVKASVDVPYEQLDDAAKEAALKQAKQEARKKVQTAAKARNGKKTAA